MEQLGFQLSPIVKEAGIQKDRLRNDIEVTQRMVDQYNEMIDKMDKSDVRFVNLLHCINETYLSISFLEGKHKDGLESKLTRFAGTDTITKGYPLGHRETYSAWSDAIQLGLFKHRRLRQQLRETIKKSQLDHGSSQSYEEGSRQ